MEKVLSVGGVMYINDSKATNVNSTWYALESIKTPIVLILGEPIKATTTPYFGSGERKSQSHSLPRRGQSQDSRLFGDKVAEIHDTRSAEEAVKIAASIAKG